MIILDTNVVSELMKPNPDPGVARWLMLLGDAPLATTAITVAEIAFGLKRLADGRRRTELETRFETYVGGEGGLLVVALDDAAARIAGQFRAIRQAAGLGAHASDMMIAGVVASLGARLATRNVADFDRLPIMIVDPWAATP